MKRKFLFVAGIGIVALVAVSWLFGGSDPEVIDPTPHRPQVHLPERPDIDADVRPEADPRAQERNSEAGPGPDAQRVDVPEAVQQLQDALDKNTPPAHEGPVTVAPSAEGMKDLANIKREALGACQDGLPKGTMPRQVRLQVGPDGSITHLTAAMGSGWEDGLLDCVAEALADVTVDNPTDGSIVLHMRMPPI